MTEHVDIAFSGDVEFRVDPEARTIAGMILPWNQTARNGGVKWSFTRGSVRWSDPSRVKMFREHDPRTAFAYATELRETQRGLFGTFKVARGTAGDEALSLAEDRVLDGLSAGLDIDPADGWVMSEDRTTRVVKSANLRETTLTAIPAYDDARITSVRAEREKGNEMPEETPQDQGGQGAAAETIDLTARFETVLNGMIDKQTESNESLSKAITDAFATVAEKIVPAQSPQQARFTIQSEPPVYRFAGPRGDHSLVKDAWKTIRERDRDAESRLLKFQAQVRDMVSKATHEFQQGTGDLSEVIPPGYRPDLYVAELVQGRPLASGVSRGTISDATPFVVPVFASSTGATGDHVEGTNPTPGTLALTSRTVTPDAISGSLQLTREIVDSSNPAIDVIAMNAMRESYAQQTEQKIRDAVVGVDGAGHADAQLHGTDVAPTDGAANADAFRERLARYPFVRFGSPSTAYLNQDATVGFATAKESGTSNAPLFPSIGAQNRAGIGNAVTQGWFVDGLPAVPAWSMPATGSQTIHTIGWNMADVWMWESPLLTFRFEEKIGPANIELALFGYFGSHVLQPKGIFAIRSPL